MITRDNIKELLQSLTEEEVSKVINEAGDYIGMQCLISNSGYTVKLESHDYDEDVERDLSDNGNLFCDKDTFLQLAKECDINWNL